MKTAEQVLNEYARLIPVACFKGHTEEWNNFVNCCGLLRSSTLNVWDLRRIILQRIIGEHSGSLLSVIDLVTRDLGSLLIDEADQLYNAIDKSLFEPKHLMKFENEEEFFETCIPPRIIPTIPEETIRHIESLNIKNRNNSLYELSRGIRQEATLNQYIRNLTGITSAEFDYADFGKGLVYAKYPNRTVITLKFENAYQYEVITP